MHAEVASVTEARVWVRELAARLEDDGAPLQVHVGGEALSVEITSVQPVVLPLLPWQ